MQATEVTSKQDKAGGLYMHKDPFPSLNEFGICFGILTKSDRGRFEAIKVNSSPCNVVKGLRGDISCEYFGQQNEHGKKLLYHVGRSEFSSRFSFQQVLFI